MNQTEIGFIARKELLIKKSGENKEKHVLSFMDEFSIMNMLHNWLTKIFRSSWSDNLTKDRKFYLPYSFIRWLIKFDAPYIHML